MAKGARGGHTPKKAYRERKKRKEAGNDSVKNANQLYDYLSQGDREVRTRDVQVREAKEYLPQLYNAFAETTQEYDALESNYFRSSDKQKARYEQLLIARQKIAHFILKLESKVADWDSYQEGNKFKEKRRKAGISDRALY